MHKNAKQLVGRVFGDLTVIMEAGRDGRKVLWSCLCSCGSVKSVRSSHLLAGKTRSCGCKKAASISSALITHGATDTPAHSVWTSMIQRCTNPKRRDWPRYGGRGISVCDRWMSFANFLADMGQPPPNMSLDRVDNDGNYEPKNCRWATASEQALNKRQPEWKKRAAIEAAARHAAVAASVKPGQLWEMLSPRYRGVLVEIMSVSSDVVTMRRVGQRAASKGGSGMRPYPIVSVRRDRITGVRGTYRPHIKAPARAEMLEIILREGETA